MEDKKLKVIYLQGAAGSGKTLLVEKLFGKKCYRISFYNYPKNLFDEYAGESIIFFDDFYHQIPLNDMLEYLTANSIIRKRYHLPEVAHYTTVLLASSLPATEQYKSEEFVKKISLFMNLKIGGK